MPASGKESFDKIQILLQEYSTLRNEILTRTSNMYQLIVGAPTAWIFLLEHKNMENTVFWVMFAILVAGCCLLGWFIARDINKAARRLRELERDINRRAKEDLLVWESQWGGAVTGFWGQAEPLPQNQFDAEPSQRATLISTLANPLSQKGSNSNYMPLNSFFKIEFKALWYSIVLILLVICGLFFIMRFPLLSSLYSPILTDVQADKYNSQEK